MKNSSKILIAENPDELGSDKEEAFAGRGFEAVFCRKNGSSVVEEIRKQEPDVVLLDMFMSGIDAVGVMKTFKDDKRKPLFVVTTSYDSTFLQNEALGAGASYYVIKPFRTEDLLERISELMSCSKKSSSAPAGKILNADSELEETVTAILHQIGVPAHIRGYHFLRTSIIMSIKQPEIINAVTKQLYPSVAEKYGTTPSRVERAVRHAIEVAWDRGDVDVLNSYFGYTIHNSRGKPTNSEFIAMISDRLRLKNKLIAS